jgi:hypothetical protein
MATQGDGGAVYKGTTGTKKMVVGLVLALGGS